jgi:tetratricopeptide (TPR) repeat protein
VFRRTRNDYLREAVSPNRGLFTFSLVVALAGGQARSALAQSDHERSAARSAADAGGDAFDQGRYADAIELFTRAEQLVHAPPHLLFMARAREKLGKLVEAHETYIKVVKEPLAANAPGAFKQAQADAQAEIGVLEARLAHVTVTVRGADAVRAVATMDGVELPSAMLGIPFPVDPGAHVFSARGPHGASSDSRLQFGEGARQSVVLELSGPGPVAVGGASAPGQVSEASPTPRAGGSKAWGVVALGAGLGAAGVATYFTVSSLRARAKATDIYACDDLGTCSKDQKARIAEHDGDADRARNWAIALYTVGVGGLVTGALLLSRDHSGAPERETHAFRLQELRLDAGPGWLGASGRF